MKLRKICGAWLALTMVAGLTLPAMAYDDTADHWGKAAIDRWSEEGILQGYDGKFRPDDPITRGELAVILDRLMDYQTQSDTVYPDVKPGSWYEEAVLGAAAANVLRGNGTFLRPMDPITRQETAVVLGRALAIAEDADGLAAFSDGTQAADWAAGYLGGMAAADILHGYQGQIQPTDTITRAEVAQLLDNAVAACYDQAGGYSADADGNVIVSAADVTLSDMTIDGNLIAAEGIGDGDLTLDNVTVRGALVVRGGGEHSIILKGNSTVSTITAERRDGGVRLSVEGNATVEVIQINDGSDAVIVDGTVGTLNVAGAEAQVTVTGTVGTVTVAQAAQGASVTVSESGKVESLVVAASGAGVTVSGTVSTVTANGAGTTVSGTGKVDSVTANADNVAVSTSGTKVEAAENASGVTAGNQPVSGGSSVTTGGSTGGSVTACTVTYQFLEETLGTEQVSCGGHPTGANITVPTQIGYEFVGWKVNGAFPTADDLSTVTITENTTLEAFLAAVPDGEVTAVTDGIEIGEADEETFLQPVTGTLTANEDGDYVLSLQLKAPEGLMCEPETTVLRIIATEDGIERSHVDIPYKDFVNGVFTFHYSVASEDANFRNQILTFFLKWHGVDSDLAMGGWATDLDLSGLALGTADAADTEAFANGNGSITGFESME